MSESGIQPFENVSPNEPRVRGFLHVPLAPSGNGLVLTHGAGTNCQSPLLIALATELCSAGLTVLRCDLPFRQIRAQGPPQRGSAKRDQQGIRAAVASLRQLVPRVFLGGHSYGGRQATMLAAVEPDIADGLLLLSYPLHPPRRPTELRTAHFPNLRTPALFVQGRRDGFGSIDEMTLALSLIHARTQLLAVEGAGHELMSNRNRSDLPTMIAEAFTGFFGIHQADYRRATLAR